MFRRRRDPPPSEAAPEPPVAPATTMARPTRTPTGMGLRSRPSGFGARLRSILGAGTPATEQTWDEVEELLIAADVGAETTITLVEAARARFVADGGRTGDDARRALTTEIRDRLERVGSGSFELGAAVIAQRSGADPGAVAFDAVAAAEARGLDAVLVDTAGRLQNKQQLMDELSKIKRVIERRLPDQPRHVLLVLDATTGQNGLLQAEAFSREAGVTGIVLTKLDGSAKGGVAVGVADRLGVPILFAGVGEDIDALAPFDPDAYVEWLFAE